jgi:pSer/pThr/pTyr-binding forkhead associated (FHA) protein
MKVVLIKFKADQRRDFPLSAQKTLLGRGTDCSLRVPARDVSRKHCEIEVTAGKAMLRDLGSSNGTFVNGKRVTEAPLQAGDRLTLGPVTFVVQIDGKPASISPADAVAPRAKPDSGALDLDSDLLDLDEVDFEIDDEEIGTDFGDEPEAPGPKSAAPPPKAAPSPPKPPPQTPKPGKKP